MSITPESVQALLSSEDYGDRISGLNQLRHLDNATGFALIQPVLADPQARVRYAAVSQMDRLGVIDPEKTLSLLREVLLHDSEVDVQSAAADAIAALKLTEGFADLKAAYEGSSEWLLQFSIVAALGEMGDPRGFDILADAIASDNNLLQTAAISAFGELGDPRAIPLLLPFQNDPDWQVRYRLAQALNRLGGEAAQAVLTQLAADSVEIVAEEAKTGHGA
ncbi:HEAT repeat domain-containing protein [Spirulina sp. CCNP1310]|uniref:phycobilisome degradation protein NblB n=1 Tax=Spirulina sp. CCNP1310 TaxID=3110249 RepID=UPI002B1EE884|nr:HEAT repeat domain-containing protein [Spirulina sp. CCNP1310]MEA5418810.1 HEAT repeat domain-containing protein [Spirulina sp. CCNP1310]